LSGNTSYQILSFYIQILDGLNEDQRKLIDHKNLERIGQSSTAVNAILKQVMEGSILWADFKYFAAEEDKVIVLCEVTDDWKNSAELLKKRFHQLKEALEMHTEFARRLENLWGICSRYAPGKSSENICKCIYRTII